MKFPKIIAIDGPAASGKSTLGEKIAQHIGYLYFDTGIMYRAVTYAALKVLQSVDDEPGVTNIAQKVYIDVRPPTIKDGRKNDVILDGDDITKEIRKPEIDKNVSQVSAYIGVRKAMTTQQQNIGRRGNIVMVGRDIGTVVLPEADLKIFLDASLEERAKRRFNENNNKSNKVTLKEIFESLSNRDKIDCTREVAPLCAADDAIVIISDGKTIEDVFQIVMGNIFKWGENN